MKIEMWLVMMMVLISTISAQRKIDVPSVVTPSFFNSIISVASSSCKGKRFYTRSAFLNAVNSFPKFGDGANLDAKREIAAFFAHVTHETGHFCYIDEIGAETRPYCNRQCTSYPCKAKKSYHGRGPIQLTWNCNYGACGKDLRLDLLNRPELLSTNANISFKSALWFWMNRVHPKLSQGFGATIRAINGGECNGGKPQAVRNRVDYYIKYCKIFGINPGSNLYC